MLEPSAVSGSARVFILDHPRLALLHARFPGMKNIYGLNYVIKKVYPKSKHCFACLDKNCEKCYKYQQLRGVLICSFAL